ncbi:DUF3772 domain-containing protein [Rhodosalinus sp. FB01]|uniref:DUF3772 domain-containing protein n=1 Tax=Rhodosalinus sp. FB01 TaxID=3239194 RepID=UPI0035240B88
MSRSAFGMIRATALAAAVLFWMVVGALAQDAPVGPIDYESWAMVADRAEQVVEAGRASNEALEDLRGQIAEWRMRFIEAQDQNAARIATLRTQLAALGPVPEDGTESDEIAARRAELRTQLEGLLAPVLRAEEAFKRADGLIREIDGTIRQRQLRELRSLGPSPLNPIHWPDALEDLSRSAVALQREFRENWASPTVRAQMRDRAPVTLGMIAVGLLLALRGPRWVRIAGARLRQSTRRGTGVWTTLVSLGTIILPLVGFSTIVLALRDGGGAGVRGELLLSLLPGAAALLLGYRWIGLRLFSQHEREAIIPIEGTARFEARWYTSALALLMVLHLILGRIVELENYAPESVSVLAFPVIALVGLVLFRLGQILSNYSAEPEDDGEEVFHHRLIRLAGRISMVVAVAAPVLAGIGYRAAAEVIYPWVLTLAIAGIVLILQRFVRDVYRLVTKRTEADPEGLIPVMLGMLLSLLALPFIALVWGARVADLTEFWATLREGVVLGETRITLSDFLTLLIVFLLGYLGTRLLQGTLRNSILPKTKIDVGGRNAIVSGVGYVGILLAGLFAVSVAGIDLSGLAIVAGALSVGVGFGLRTIVENFVSGIILLIERPVSEGDWIEVNGQMGYVRAISVRSTRIETFDRTDVVIPNADLVSGVVTNWTRGNTIGRVIVPVGVAYGTDTRKVEKILMDVAEDHPMVLVNPPPAVLFKGFGDKSLDFEIRAILRDVNWMLSVHSDMNHDIAQRFAEEGIEIPFPQRDVWLKTPETLHKSAPPPPAAAAPDESTPQDGGSPVAREA